MQKLAYVCCVLAVFLAAPAFADATPAKPIVPTPTRPAILKLSSQRLTGLVDELNGFYTQSLDALFAAHNDESERQLGATVAQRLMAKYDRYVAGRCTKALVSQTLHQYILGAQARLGHGDAAAEEAVAKQREEYAKLLAKFGLKADDLRETGECTAFEYDLEPLYEGQITVADPGWWIFGQKDTTKTFFRLMALKRRDDGAIEVEGYVGGGRPKGRYTGLARFQSATNLQVSLMRVGKPLLIDGELSMTGLNYQDPITGEAAPKMPARVLTGMLTVRDQAKFASTNAVMLVARESDAAISRALGGFKVPSNEKLGNFLNLVVVSFRGRAMSRDYMKFAGLIDDAYRVVQKDNPVKSFHPTRKPLFVNPEEAAFVIIDMASDVNALVVKKLRSAETLAAAKALGAGEVDVFPFYKVKAGKLRVQLSGRPAAELKFKSYEELARALFTMFTALGQEQQLVFEKHGIKALSDQIVALQKDVADLFKAMGPALDILLNGQTYTEELDKKLMGEMQNLAALRDKLTLTLSTILDTRKMPALIEQYEGYLAKERDVLELAAAGQPADRVEANRALLDKLAEGSGQMLESAKRFANAVTKNERSIALALDYMNLFSVRVQLAGSYVDRAGKLGNFEWKWERTLPRELEVFFDNGGRNEQKQSGRAGRRGD